MVKLWLRRIHLLIAVFAGLFLINSSITGTLLIYAKNIQQAINPNYWQVEPQVSPLDFVDIVDKVEKHTAEKVRFVEPASAANLAWQVQLNNQQYVSINPYSGEVLLQYHFYDTFYGFTLGLHRWLLFQDKDEKTPFRVLVSTASLCLIVELVLGFYLWFRPKNRIKRLKINKNAKTKILFYQLHTVIGVYALLPLLLVAFSGMTFYWKTQTASVVEVLTLGDIDERPAPPTIQTALYSPLQLGLAIENGLNALPQASLFRLYMPTDFKQAMALRVQTPEEIHANSWIWVNPYSAQVLNVYDASQVSFATQVWNFRYKFHIGDFAGPIMQFIWIFVALTPLFFVLSGCYLWYSRHKKTKPTCK
ncbi:PepSY-associated TM helix domain-containing protein [Paraglaciecola sp.]|uniref:PepSY-associated TM helix domain-containing protein n=1 Tax=Paraglaciecola sp. TaxID=1920173 RepID=UPI0030F405CF